MLGLLLRLCARWIAGGGDYHLYAIFLPLHLYGKPSSMPRPIQLGIPMPCHEQWSNMQPAEKGRHCSACQKTVVDFTAMSDSEIIWYLARTGPDICGRVAPDQLNRNLAMLPPPKRNGWSGWRWLLAGILITSNEQHYEGPSKPGVHEHRGGTVADNPEEVILGKISAPPLIGDTVQTDSIVTETDTSGIVMGVVMINDIDSVFNPKDTIQGPPLPTADSSIEPAEDRVFNGGLVISRESSMDTVKQFVADTLTAIDLPSKVDSVKQFLIDTLTTLHILPNSCMKIYPNPAPRGSSIYLSWRTEPGTYRVALYSSAGVLIIDRVVQVNSRTQEDSWEVPGGMAGGVYIIRVTQSGRGGGYTKKLVIL